MHPREYLANWTVGMLLARNSATSPTLHTTAPHSGECPTLTVGRSVVPRLRNPALEPSQREGQCEAVPAKATSLSSCCPIPDKALTVRLRNVCGGLAKGPGIRRKNRHRLRPQLAWKVCQWDMGIQAGPLPAAHGPGCLKPTDKGSRRLEWRCEGLVCQLALALCVIWASFVIGKVGITDFF